jgi:hypothetical protein
MNNIPVISYIISFLVESKRDLFSPQLVSRNWYDAITNYSSEMLCRISNIENITKSICANDNRMLLLTLRKKIIQEDDLLLVFDISMMNNKFIAVEMIVNSGIINNYYKRHILHAIRTEPKEIIEKILEKSELSPTNLLHLASQYRNVDVIDLLISKGADLNIQTGDHYLPIHTSAYYDNISAFLYFINNNLYSIYQLSLGAIQDTSITLAVRCRSRKIIEYLLNDGFLTIEELFRMLIRTYPKKDDTNSITHFLNFYKRPKVCDETHFMLIQYFLRYYPSSERVIKRLLKTEGNGIKITLNVSELKELFVEAGYEIEDVLSRRRSRS